MKTLDIKILIKIIWTIPHFFESPVEKNWLSWSFLFSEIRTKKVHIAYINQSKNICKLLVIIDPS